MAGLTATGEAMADKIVPMIHVPDVRATAAWYVGIGFSLAGSNEEDGVMNWARLCLGDGELMLNVDGRPSAAWRREVDLYVHTRAVDALFVRLAGRAEVVEAPHDTFYGMREFIVRDCNRFWLTFGEPAASAAGGRS